MPSSIAAPRTELDPAVREQLDAILKPLRAAYLEAAVLSPLQFRLAQEHLNAGIDHAVFNVVHDAERARSSSSESNQA